MPSASATFELFAQSPPYAPLNAVYMNFDPRYALDMVKSAAGLSDNVMGQWPRR
jgi:4-hydroxyphenylacetate 3-monooxygenase